VDGGDELRLGGRLDVVDLEAVAGGRGPGGGDVVGEGGGAVHGRLTLAQEVEVRPVQEQDDGPAAVAGVGHRQAASAASIVDRGTSRTGSTPRVRRARR
jgi:hypothetical protein